MRLMVGLRPDPLGELTALPQTPSRIKGVRKREGRGVGKRKGDQVKGGKGEKQRGGPHPMSEVR